MAICEYAGSTDEVDWEPTANCFRVWATPNTPLDVAEMRKLRWKCGVTKLARIGHERITGTMELGEIFGESLEKEIEIVRVFHEMRLGLCLNEGNVNIYERMGEEG